MHVYNAYLEYDPVTGDKMRFPLWVMEFRQPYALSGSTAQSHLTRHFYPRAYSPGPMTIEGRCTPGPVKDVPAYYSDLYYQKLALFIRNHQKELVTTLLDFLRGDGPGFKTLLRLSITKTPNGNANEGVIVRGWIESFTLIKKGRMNPGPEYTFDFQVIYDSQSTTVQEISHDITQHFPAPGTYYDRPDAPVDLPDNDTVPPFQTDVISSGGF
jgi:hypothetical protein